MKSIHTNERGKYANAVYECVVLAPQHFAEDMVEKIFPRAWGVSVTAWGWTQTSSERRWMMLVTNGRQTTVADVVVRLERMGVAPIVRVVASTPTTATAERTGTTRKGTVRVRAATPHGKVVTAR